MENESMEPAEDFTEKTEEDILEVFSDELSRKTGSLKIWNSIPSQHSEERPKMMPDVEA